MPVLQLSVEEVLDLLDAELQGVDLALQEADLLHESRLVRAIGALHTQGSSGRGSRRI